MSGVKKNIGRMKIEVPDGGDRPGDRGRPRPVWIKPKQGLETENRFAGFEAVRKQGHHGDQHDHPAEIAEAPGGIG